jgi:hypothetical protein
MLINEKQLSMMNPDHRRYLQEEMAKFLSNEAHDTATGYVPPSTSSPGLTRPIVCGFNTRLAKLAASVTLARPATSLMPR